VEDLLMMLTQDPDATAIMKASGVDPAAIRERLAHSAEIATPGDRNNMIDPQPTPAFQRVVQRAILDAQASGEWIVTGAHMLGAILSEQEGTAARILREQGLSRSDVVKIARSTG
jgi:ATP-dependent Clp protease ATP-binding subunit ClpA